jgi:hypothetical protein
MAGVVTIISNNTSWKHVRKIRQHAVNQLRHCENFERKGEAENVSCRKCVREWNEEENAI